MYHLSPRNNPVIARLEQQILAFDLILLEPLLCWLFARLPSFGFCASPALLIRFAIQLLRVRNGTERCVALEKKRCAGRKV